MLGVPELVSGQAGTWRVSGYFEYRDSRVQQLGLEYRDLAGWSIGTWRAGVSGLGGCWDSSIGTPGRPSIGTVRVLALEWAGFGQLECRDSPHSGTWRDSGPAGVPGLVSGLAAGQAAGLAAGRPVALAPGRAAGTSTGTEYRDELRDSYRDSKRNS